MKVIENENTVFIDVDETLIIHRRDKDSQGYPIGKVDHKIKDPHTGTIHYVMEHGPHIDYLKKSKGRNRFVVVWSANGYAWAEIVLKTLGLQGYVDQVMTKPNVYFDDVDANSFMQRVYIKLEDK